MKHKKIVVTGLGVVSPIGSSIDKMWSNALEGVCGIRKIPELVELGLPVQIAGNIIDFDPNTYISPKNQKKMDLFIQYGMAAAIQAIQDAGLEASPSNAERIGVAIGSGIGGLDFIEKNYDNAKEKGVRKVSPFFIPGTIINMIAGNLTIEYGFKGPNMGMVSACTTGTHNIGEAARMIDYGTVDVMIAGSAEFATTMSGVSGFAAARALTTGFNDAPHQSSRPWDSKRSGFVLGAGAGVVVLESYEHAQARGAHIYCELAGYGASSDAYHMTAPSPEGEGAILCMKNALADAQEATSNVAYINAHATSTLLGDVIESKAIKTLFGEHAKNININATKSLVGHLVGAAGSVEAIVTILTLRDQKAHPTINLEEPDPECDLDYIPNQARDIKATVGLSNSFGFGGTNGALVFRKI